MSVINVCNLDFRYRPEDAPVLQGIDLKVDPGSRCVVIGANGAGKTTLLRVLAGRHMIRPQSISILGRPAFHDTSLAADVVLLSGTFHFEVDVTVAEILDHQRYEIDRGQRLIRILGVDRDWHMHRISAGQRRRVQILLGLLHPYQLLLLDEITTDLDLVARIDLLALLREETEQRRCTIVYATHILDRLEEWATHLAFIDQGRLLLHQPLAQVNQLNELRAQDVSSPLSYLAERWLRDPPQT